MKIPESPFRNPSQNHQALGARQGPVLTRGLRIRALGFGPLPRALAAQAVAPQQ